MIDEHDGWDENAYKFKLYGEAFEALCAGVLKTKNYSGKFDEAYGDGLLAVFKKITEML